MDNQGLTISTRSGIALTVRLVSDQELQLMIHEDAVWEHMAIDLNMDQIGQLIDVLQLYYKEQQI